MFQLPGSRMSQIRDFFSGQKRSYKPKKNFIKENIRRLQEISQSRPAEPVKSGSFPKFHRAFSDIKQQEPDTRYALRRDNSNLSLNQAKLKDTFLNEFAALPSGYRHQSSQTLAEKDLDSLYHEGVIRFPTSKVLTEESKGQIKLFRTISLQTETPTYPVPTSPTPSGSPAGDSVKDFVKMNAQIQVQPKRKDSSLRDPIRPPPNYQMGALPKYLREQKKEHEKHQKEMQTPSDPDCPPGHAVLPEAERLKHLAQLRERYSDLVNQLNSLPVKTDTLRTRRRKMEIEKELDKIDAGIKLFSRDKLFIKVAD